MADSFIIETDELRKNYGPVEAVRGLNLQVPAGSICGFLGRNGAGKTTTIKVLLGMARPTSGHVRVFGLAAEAQQASVDIRRRTGFVSDDKDLYGYMTVEEMVRFTAAFFPRWRADLQQRYLRTFELPLDRKVKALSGGMRTKLALLLALCRGAELLILDEPTSGLDPIARRQIHDILIALKRRGKLILLSSHYLDEIEALADRVIIMSAGRIVADGTPLELLARSAGASTLWLDVSGVDDPSRLLPQATFEGRDGAMFRYRTADPTAAIVALADSLRASGAKLADLRLKRPSLEDVYLELIAGGRS